MVKGYEDKMMVPKTEEKKKKKKKSKKEYETKEKPFYEQLDEIDRIIKEVENG